MALHHAASFRLALLQEQNFEFCSAVALEVLPQQHCELASSSRELSGMCHEELQSAPDLQIAQSSTGPAAEHQ